MLYAYFYGAALRLEFKTVIFMFLCLKVLIYSVEKKNGGVTEKGR